MGSVGSFWLFKKYIHFTFKPLYIQNLRFHVEKNLVKQSQVEFFFGLVAKNSLFTVLLNLI